MAKLSYKRRKKMKSSEFAEPGKRKYPVEDRAHARNALARVSQHGTAEEKKIVRRKVHAKFPDIGEGKKTHHKKTHHKRTASKG